MNHIGRIGASSCKAYAISMSYKYFALQATDSCFVSNNYKQSTQYGIHSSGCSQGDCSNGVCVYGGDWANALYILGISSNQIAPLMTLVNITYVGCYTDTNNRAMEVFYNAVTPLD